MANSRNQLHQAVIQDHFRRPRNRGALDGEAVAGSAHNPFCGDTVKIWVKVEAGTIRDVAFDGRGCSISMAAASILTVAAKGRRACDMGGLRQAFVDGLAPDGATPMPAALGDMRALAGVSRFPSRIRCAVLPFEALEAALRGVAPEMTKAPPPGR